MWEKLFSTTDGLRQGIEASWLRNEVIANNIANADTPGFKVSEVRFEDIMAQAVSSGGFELKATRPEHFGSGTVDIGNVSPVVVTDENSSYRSDDNNVDAEAQMSALAQNSLEYYTLVSKLNSEFDKLNMAISGQ